MITKICFWIIALLVSYGSGHTTPSTAYQILPDMAIVPQSPIMVIIGETVHVNCTQLILDSDSRSSLRWELPWPNLSSLSGGSEVILNRFTSKWVASNTLQLVIINVTKHDAGSFTCYGSRGMQRTVKLWIKGNETRPCSVTTFRCGDGRCIFWRYRCDTVTDCVDGSDELGCDYHCEGKFKCDNGQCVERDLVCDEYKSHDCRDGSDEKNCEFSPGSSSRPESRHHNHGFHFNPIYSAVASVVGLICVAAIVVLTICRMHMRRESLRQMRAVNREFERRPPVNRGNRASWFQSTPFFQPPEVESGYVPPRCPGHTNLAVNINLRFSSSGVPELAALMTPPPYSEVEPPPREGTPPPPYSTMDRGHLRPPFPAHQTSDSGDENTLLQSRNNSENFEQTRREGESIELQTTDDGGRGVILEVQESTAASREGSEPVATTTQNSDVR